MYRGMHHPLDVAGGVIVGLGAVLVLLFACRAARAPPARAPARSRAPSGAGSRRAGGVMKVAVVAHAEKRLDGGLPELRRVLAAEGIEIRSGTRCPRPSRRPSRCGGRSTRAPSSSSRGAATARCGAASASSPGEEARLAVLPAGTANLFATNLGIPKDIERAVAIGLRGDAPAARRRPLRGRALRGHGRRRLRRGDDPRRRRPQGRASAARRTCGAGRATCATRRSRPRSRSTATEWFEGRATCILLGNVGELFGGVEVFPDARPDDGRLELGVVTAEGLVQWARTLARTAAGDPARSPFVRATKAEAVKVEARTARSATSSTAATARRSSRSRSRSSRARCASASRRPGEGE